MFLCTSSNYNNKAEPIYGKKDIVYLIKCARIVQCERNIKHVHTVDALDLIGSLYRRFKTKTFSRMLESMIL